MRPTSTQVTYDVYAKVYDALKGDRSGNIQLLKDLIATYHPSASTVLDLACGTGAITQALVGSYAVAGVDNAPQMLQVAQKKLPQVPFVCASMVDFKISQKFDVIYCLHNSVNHLLTFDEWEKMFANVAAHLADDGIFIFGCNPIARMDNLTTRGVSMTEVGEHYVIAQVRKDAEKRESYLWDVKIFLHQQQNIFTLHDEPVTVSAYPLEQIDRALSKDFDITDFFILERAQKSDDIGRAYYVCAKKGTTGM